jgi:hypothetical protein
MNKKIAIIIALIYLLAQCVSLMSLAHAQKTITAWTDKPIYNPGESGTLYIAFYNTRDGAVTVKKIVIFFEGWRAFKNGKWEGNKTLEINKALASGEAYSINTDFNVPTDGRAIDTTVEIEVYTEEAGVIDPQGPEAVIYVSKHSALYGSNAKSYYNTCRPNDCLHHHYCGGNILVCAQAQGHVG